MPSLHRESTDFWITLYFRLVLHHFILFFHAGFRFERPQYYVHEHDGTLKICTTYKGENVPQSLEVKANLRPTGKPRMSTCCVQASSRKAKSVALAVFSYVA